MSTRTTIGIGAALAVVMSACSFDFAAAPADASNERDQGGRDVGGRDASVAGPVVLEAGPDGAPEIVFEPSGQCGTTEANVVSGGGSCADGILASTLSKQKGSAWELSCAGDKTSEVVVCVWPHLPPRFSRGTSMGQRGPARTRVVSSAAAATAVARSCASPTPPGMTRGLVPAREAQWC